MPKAVWALRLWPGLLPLWQRGAWSGLALAIGFSLLLNLTVATTWLWTEMVSPAVRSLAWLVVGGIWLVSLVASRGWWQAPPLPEGPTTEALFQSAMLEYLRGHWLEAETRLRQLLSRNSQDAEARLMLATLFRHAGRWEEARRELARLSTFESAAKWSWEIEREYALLAELASPVPSAGPAWMPEANSAASVAGRAAA